MLELSNGQAITVSSERARYHATRRRLQINRQTPHTELYALVDVLVRQAKHHSSLIYSGYTLADLPDLQLLTDADRQNLARWTSLSHIRYEVEGARRRLIYDALPTALITHPYPEKLYSRLAQRIRAMPMTTMSARQWQQTLLNLQQQGISKEELHWSGILSWLNEAGQEKNASITRQAVLEKVDFFQIRMQLSNELSADEKGSESGFRNKYRHISLHGGEDYREWLLSLPDYRESYFGPHFTERNVLLHIRSKTRYDTKARKLLFIEEIQSDWHQVSYINYSTLSKIHVPPAPFRKTWAGLGVKLMLMHAVEEGYAGIAWADGTIQARRYRTGFRAVQRIYNESIPRALLKLAKPWNGALTSTEIESKTPCFRLERVRRHRSMAAKHGFVKIPLYNRAEILSILDAYRKTELIKVPVFILPEKMAEHINHAGLPLFGEKC